MRTVVVIPTRYGSTRYLGKALAPLRGASGETRSLVRRVWDAALQVADVDAVYVATDDDRIRLEAESFGATVAMTPVDCQNGTERCAAALSSLDAPPDIVVNIQGDAPLTPPWFVEALIAKMRNDPSIAVATPALRCDGAALAQFREDRRQGRVGGTTVAFGVDWRAMYFSKEVIPYVSETYEMSAPTPVFHHVGVYAYRPAALFDYASWAASPLETLEGLEQLRFMENGVDVTVVEVDARGRVFWELNNPEDVARIEAALKDLGVD